MSFMICYLCSSHLFEAGGAPLEKGDIFFCNNQGLLTFESKCDDSWESLEMM